MTSPRTFAENGSIKSDVVEASPDDVFAAHETRVSSDPTIEPGVAPSSPSSDIEVLQPGELGENEWEHERLEFKGELLEVRVPTQQALAAFSLASSKYVPMQVKNDIVGLFVSKHLSEKSYGHVWSRLISPDETEYNVETIGELMRSIAMMGVEQSKLEAGPSST